MRRSLALGLAAAWLASVPSTVTAQPAWDAPSPRGFDLVPRTGANLELGFWSHDTDDAQLLSLSGLLRAGIVLDRTFEIGLTAGWVWANLTPIEGALTAAGSHGAATNPHFSFTQIFADEERWRLRIGAGFTIPATPPSDDARDTAFLGSGMRGYSELWLWSADRGAATLEATLQLVPLDMLYIELSARGAGLFTLTPRSIAAPQQRDSTGTEHFSNVDATIDLHAAIGLRIDNFFGGFRFREVINPTFVGDLAQSSLELFLRGTGRIDDTSIELFGEARALTNLDDPYGLASTLPLFGVHVSFGISTTPEEIPDGRYGVAEVRFEGTDRMDGESIAACLGTRRRSHLGFDIGVRGAPRCGEPPFDGDHLLLELFSYPWTSWPLFDGNVFERDVERIERWYRARGFYEARVTSTTIDPPEASQIDHAEEGCGDGDGHCEAEVTFSIDEGEPVQIERMSIRGLGALPDDMRAALRATLQFERVERPRTEGGEPEERWGRFDEALYETTKSHMLRVLADAGYGHALVRGSVKINARRHEAYIVFNIDAGAPNVIGRVCVVGNGELPAGPMIGVAGLEAGGRFSLEGLGEAQRALYALGVFSAVEVTPILPDRSSEAQLERAVEAQRGHESSVPDAERLIPEDAVCSDPPEHVPEGHEPVDILLRVTAGRRYRLGLGGGFQAGQSVTLGTVQASSNQQNAAQWDLHLSFMVEDRNFLESMIRARFEIRPRAIFDMPFLNFVPAEPSPFGILTTGSLRWPGFLEARTNLLVQTRLDIGPMPFTNFFRLEVDAIVGPERTWFDGRLYLGVFVHGNYFVPTDRQPLEPRDRLPRTFATYVEEVVRLDLRDDPRNPHAGVYLAASSQQIFGEPSISSWHAVRWNAEGRGYLPLGDVVIAARFSIGGMHVLSFDGDSLPDNNRYQLHQLGPPALQLRGGGASSNRGFLPGLLGDARQIYVSQARDPEDIRAGRPIQQRMVRISGGTAMWQASLEVRIPVTADIGVVAFADAGDVIRPATPTDEAFVGFRFDRPQISLGLGLRYRTIIGPLRLDVALRPNALQDFSEDGGLPPTCSPANGRDCRLRNTIFGIPGAFHLTIGESF